MNEYIYCCENSAGKTYFNYDREETFDWYEKNNGIKIWTKTKDLFPTIKVIVDSPNVDIRNIRKDDIVSETSVALRKAVAKYDKTHTKQIALKLNIETDKDILEALEDVGVGNKQTLIKDAIRAYLKKENEFEK